MRAAELPAPFITQPRCLCAAARVDTAPSRRHDTLFILGFRRRACATAEREMRFGGAGSITGQASSRLSPRGAGHARCCHDINITAFRSLYDCIITLLACDLSPSISLRVESEPEGVIAHGARTRLRFRFDGVPMHSRRHDAYYASASRWFMLDRASVDATRVYYLSAMPGATMFAGRLAADAGGRDTLIHLPHARGQAHDSSASRPIISHCAIGR